MFIVFGSGYHVFMAASRIGFVYSYMLLHETYFCGAVSILESRILWMEVGYAPPSLKFYRSCAVFAKLIFVGSFHIVYFSNDALFSITQDLFV